ncbi:hypothetical protein ACFOLJ_10735 [Rugamonas sp. CCM 8940]|uniref:hypothetical protein n=1 Tax=Rugamonas sp. CCM 8940 TaxID=2765359 RepID=UPI0018F3EE7A|nr:hypothetical protein [Rugamonas sp. CCM 8940]MBJ7309775.1 hypothetical protein [Rugamonas sp. CCM 8940]
MQAKTITAPALPARQIVQARLTIKNGTKQELVKAIEKTGLVRPNRVHRLPIEIGHMIRSTHKDEQFGEVDVNNAQQVALVAYRLAQHRFTAKPIIAPSRNPNRVYELAIVGAGSTAAYYIDTLGPAYDHSHTVVIGGNNPWMSARGHGIAYINHTRRQIAMPSENVTEHGGNESFVNRRAFALASDRVVGSTTGRWIHSDKVTNISLLAGVYTITYGNGQTVRASKVTFAGGGGPLRKPTELTDESKAIRNGARIIDMNTFIRKKVRLRPRGRVVIWGSNAAIDAVAAAKRFGWTIVKWLYNAEPAWLPGSRYKSKPYRLQEVQRDSSHPYKGRNDIKIEDSGNKLQVRDTSTGLVIAANIDFVVYGLGTDDLLTDGAAVMDASVLEGAANLSPMLDDGGIFGATPSQDNESSRAFLGWRNTAGTFKVVGLAAENYTTTTARDGKQVKTRINSKDDPRVQALKEWVSGDVATVGQLTYIRSAVRAVNNYVPPSIVERVDYSHADRNQLRVHLQAKYPSLPESYAQAFIALVHTVRTGYSARLPHGFTAQQTAFLDQQLAAKHQQAKRGRVSSLGAWEQWMRSRLVDMMPSEGVEVSRGLAKLPRNKR